ncbi:MAG: outer membrane beta-barrel protein [Nitrospirae bacterium]|nr:outer membrane beta-barrel protein [Nitrospirota bacterium]MDA1303244.1 outer membrane beta-barrel protein [Nitrospirota bacterium]
MSWGQVSGSSVTLPFTGAWNPAPGDFTAIFPGKGVVLGPFRIHPFLGLGETFTDNVFRSKNNRKSDFIHFLSPGVQLQIPMGQHQFAVDYRVIQQVNQRFSENDVLTQDASGQVFLNFPNGLTVNLQGGHIEGFDRRGSQLDLQTTGLTTWNTNTFIGEAEFIGSWAGVRMNAESTQWNYENNNQAPARDRTSHDVDLTFFGSVTSKTYVLLSFGASKENYSSNIQLDSTSYRASTGLRWAATGKTTGEIQVGYEILNYDRAPVIQPTGSLLSDGGDKQEILRVSGELEWRPTSRTFLTFSPFRSLEQSAVFNTAVFTRTGVDLAARQQLGSRTTMRGNFQVDYDEFANDNDSTSSSARTDMRWVAGINLEYRAVQWLGFGLGYSF